MSRLLTLSDHALRTALRLRGFESRHVRTGAGTVHLLDARGQGSLPPLLVLHGFSAASHHYDGVMLRMRPHVGRVLAPDLLGHGLSETPSGGLDPTGIGAALVEALGRVLGKPAIVFGNSLGGAAALRLAIARPDLVAGLFLVAPGGAPMPPEELAAFVHGFRLESHDQALDSVDRLFHRPHPFRHVLAWGTRHKLDRPELRELLGRARPDDLLRPAELAALPMPVEVVWGGADRILRGSHLEFFRQHLPAHARVEVVPHFGHAPHMDHPAELHRRLLAFARRATPAERPNSPRDPGPPRLDGSGTSP